MKLFFRGTSSRKLLAGMTAVLLCLGIAGGAVHATGENQEKSDGIHIKNVPEGVVTVTIGTRDGGEITVDDAGSRGIQWKLDTRCSEENVQSVRLNYADGTSRELALAFRTDAHTEAGFYGAIIGNTGNGTLNVWICGMEAEPAEEPEDAPGEAPGEAPEEKPEDAPTEVPEEKPEDAPAEEPEEKPEDAPAEAPEEKPEDAPAEAPEEKPEDAPAEAPEEKPEDAPAEAPEKGPVLPFTGSGSAPDGADAAAEEGRTADVPGTGDDLDLWLLLTVLSGSVMLWAVLPEAGRRKAGGPDKG